MNLVHDPRAAGQIRRYHTWAVIKDQTVAEHTWQIIRILLTIWPNAPRNLLIYAVLHDMGEMAGDVQYPFKILFQELRNGSEKAEVHVRKLQRETLGAPDVKHPISQFEKYVFKACDNLEMWEYGIRERNMGNMYANIIVTRMMSAVAENTSEIYSLRDTQQFQQNPDIVASIQKYMKTRLEMESEIGNT